VVVASPDGGEVRRLATDATPSLPTWSRDGKMVYFSAVRNGQEQIMKVPEEGGQAKQLTHRGGHHAVESIDGKWLYYLNVTNHSGVWRVPVTGGDEIEIAEGDSCAVSTRGLFFYRSSPAGDGVEFWLLPPHGAPAKVIGTIHGLVIDGFAVAPDSRSMIYTQFEFGADVMLIENFR
jgi:WD40-like Beta Propeller Repeat